MRFARTRVTMTPLLIIVAISMPASSLFFLPATKLNPHMPMTFLYRCSLCLKLITRVPPQLAQHKLVVFTLSTHANDDREIIPPGVVGCY